MEMVHAPLCKCGQRHFNDIHLKVDCASWWDRNIGYTPIWRCICYFGNLRAKPEVSKIAYVLTKRCITDLNYDSFGTYHSCINFNGCSVVLKVTFVIVLIVLEEFYLHLIKMPSPMLT